MAALLEEKVMQDVNPLVWIALCSILIALDIWAIVSVFRSDKTVGVKSAWAIGITVVPLLGLVYWGIAGPRGLGSGPSSPEHSK